MKKRTRKLTKEQLEALQRSVQRFSVKEVLYMGKIVPHTDDPRVVAKYFAQEFFECFPTGAESLDKFIKYLKSQWKVVDAHTIPERERRFFARTLIALGEYILNGQGMFDDVDLDAVKIKRLKPTITVPQIISELEKQHPTFTRDALEKRVRRLLKSIRKYSQEYLGPEF